MTKQEKALEVIERLRKEYPDAGCTLDYDDAWKLLVSVRLAAQCTDARVNVVVEDLYAKYPDVNALAEAPVEEVEKIVRPCGLGKSKARDICACMKILKEEYQGKGFKETDPFIYTERGERVRSKSEKILADYFYSHNIPYKYEHPLYLTGFGIVYPDFTVLSQRTRHEMYWEHNGRMEQYFCGRKINFNL